MARKTFEERTTILEDREDFLMSLQARNEAIKEIKGQGTDGASTQFSDPQIIQDEIKQIRAELSIRYRA